MSMHAEQAAKIGAEHGRNAASYVFDGNTADETYRAVLAGIDDGDPAILDSYRTPDLSGEFSGDYSEHDLISDLGLSERMPDGEWSETVSEAATAYNDAASESFWAEVERICRDHAESATIERLRSAGFPVTWADDSAVMDSGYLLCYSHYRHNGPTSQARAYVDLGSIARGEDTAGQSSTVDRSNYRSLVRDYPGIWTPIAYSNVDSLGAFLADLTSDVVDILTGLAEQYPLYDESDLSELESEEITDSWEQYVRLDLPSELPESVRDAWDALTDDEQRALFWQACGASDYYPEHDGFDVCWRYDQIMPALITALCELAPQRCATVGCQSAATETITWRDRENSGDAVTERVCTPCAESYARRPALKVTRGS